MNPIKEAFERVKKDILGVGARIEKQENRFENFREEFNSNFKLMKGDFEEVKNKVNEVSNFRKDLEELKDHNLATQKAVNKFSDNVDKVKVSIETYNVDLKAPYVLSKMVAEEMKKKSNGSIINITSLNSELAFPDNPAYITMKGGLKQLTKSLAYDLGKHNIRVNNVGPGYMKTNMTKKSWSDPKTYEERKNKTVLQRWGKPSDLIGITVFLASDASSYITGQDIYVDGGWLIKGL